MISALVLSLALTSSAHAARACAPQLLTRIGRLAADTYVGAGEVTLTFFDEDGRHRVRLYVLERARVVDGKLKLRLRTGTTGVDLVGTPVDVVPAQERQRVTLRVHRVSGPSLGLGRGLRVSFPVAAEAPIP